MIPIWRARALLTLTFALLLPSPGTAQHPAVRGGVTNAGSREPIAGARVEVIELRRHARTDSTGTYALELPRGEWTLRASAAGYRTSEQTVRIGAGGAVADFALAPAEVSLERLEVTGERRGRTADAVGPGAIRLDPGEIKVVPGVAEADVLRAVQLLPAVQAASDFSSAPYVRGGSQDQNLVLLDGIPIFNPYHLGGVFGAFDPDAIASVDVLPGAFPARLGDRLSSVIEVRTREGSREQVHGSGALGLVSSRLGVNGPLPGGRGSYLVSGRRTYLDLITDAAYRARVLNGTLPYQFTDGHLKLTHDVGRTGALTASGYLNREVFDLPRELQHSGSVDFRWGSHALALGFRQQPRPALTLEARAGVSGFGGRFLFEEDRWNSQDGRPVSAETLLDARTTMRDAFGALELSWLHGGGQTFAGVQADRYLFDHDVRAAWDEDDDLTHLLPSLRRRDTPATVAAYLEREWSMGNRLDARGGVRLLSAGERGSAWLPRGALRFALTPRLSLTAGAGRYAQALHSLRGEESMLASLIAYDFLGAVPSGGLSRSDDVALGAVWTAARTELRVDAYTRWLRELPLAPIPADVLLAPVLVRDEFEQGSGRASGVELLLRHRRERAEFMLAYALGGISLHRAGETYTPRYHRRHTLDGTATFPWAAAGLFTARLSLASGQPYTPVLGIVGGDVYDPITGTWRPARKRFVAGEHNSALLPGYLRLDLGARRSFQRSWAGRTVTLTPYLNVLNATNSKNVLIASPEDADYGQPRLAYLPQLPIFPSFGIEWTF